MSANCVLSAPYGRLRSESCSPIPSLAPRLATLLLPSPIPPINWTPDCPPSYTDAILEQNGLQRVRKMGMHPESILFTRSVMHSDSPIHCHHAIVIVGRRRPTSDSEQDEGEICESLLAIPLSAIRAAHNLGQLVQRI